MGRKIDERLFLKGRFHRIRNPDNPPASAYDRYWNLGTGLPPWTCGSDSVGCAPARTDFYRPVYRDTPDPGVNGTGRRMRCRPRKGGRLSRQNLCRICREGDRRGLGGADCHRGAGRRRAPGSLNRDCISRRLDWRHHRRTADGHIPNCRIYDCGVCMG